MVDVQLDKINNIILNYLVFIEPISSEIPSSKLHYMIQKRLSDLAEDYGLIGQMEYKLPNYYPTGRNGFIDVMWFDHASPLVAIEVDSCWRKKSLKKLVDSKVDKKIWVLYGKKIREESKTEQDPDNTVLIIHRPLERKRHRKNGRGSVND
jgi:hypothetical protein